MPTIKHQNQVKSKSRFTSNCPYQMKIYHISVYMSLRMYVYLMYSHTACYVCMMQKMKNDSYTQFQSHRCVVLILCWKFIQIQMILSSILRNQIFSELMTLSLTIFTLTSLLALHCRVLFWCKSRFFLRLFLLLLLLYLSLVRTKKSNAINIVNATSVCEIYALT